MSKALDALSKDLLGVIGANSERQEVGNWLDTGYPPLNKIMGGSLDAGFPFGRIIEMFGPSSAGKTAIATMMMIEAQRQGGVAIFIDFERSFDMRIATSMGLSDQHPFWIYKKADTWEQGNTVAMQAAELIRKSGAIEDDAPIIVVFDSIASAIPKSVFDKGIGEYTMNDTTALARVTSTTLKAVNQAVERFNMTALYLNQIRTKPGVMFGDPTTTPGGQATEFYASVRLSLSRKKIMKEVNGKKMMVGQLIKAKTVKNKITRPFQEAEWSFVFDEDGTGHFDLIGSTVDYLCGEGVLVKSGAFITWTNGKKYNRNKLVKMIEDEGLKDELYSLYPTEPSK